MKRFKRIFLVFIILGIGYFLISYSTENKKYEILNQIFAETDFQPEKICIRKEKIDYDQEMFNELNVLDKPSGYFQFVIQNAKCITELDNKISTKKIKNSKVVNDCKAEMKIIKIDEKTEKWEANSNAQISLPILSIDKKTAIIQISNNCGMLCGETTLYVFKKINGKWKVANKKMLRIS